MTESAAREYLENVLRQVIHKTSEEKAAEMMEAHRDGAPVVLLLAGSEDDVVFHWEFGRKPPMPPPEGSA
jgi:ATP-dependent Clp protease adapter protein ClpS